MIIKAIGLWQPWASGVGRGKHYETRSWKTSYRGLMAIHAAKRFQKEEQWQCWEYPFRQCLPTYAFAGKEEGSRPNLPLGAVVALVTVTGMLQMDKLMRGQHAELIDEDGSRRYISGDELMMGDYTPGRWAWEFHNIMRLNEPIPASGHQGLFNWDCPDWLIRAYNDKDLSQFEAKRAADQEVQKAIMQGPGQGIDLALKLPLLRQAVLSFADDLFP